MNENCKNKIIKIPAISFKNVYKISKPFTKTNYQVNGFRSIRNLRVDFT